MLQSEKIDKQKIEMLTNGVTADREILRYIQNRMDKTGIYYRIFARMKTAHSLTSKLIKKDDKYEKENRKLQDIIGVRIVLYYEDDICVCQKIIGKLFNVHQEDSQIDVLKNNQFEPKRMNLVCDLPEECIELMPEELWKNYRIDKTFELQIRTIFSEGWHEVEHDVRYKHKEEWEDVGYDEFHRNLNGINATLELCDKSILQILESLAHKCYKDSKIEEMFRYKFRIHLDSEIINDKLKEKLMSDKNLLKLFYRMEREKVVLILSSPVFDKIPRTLNNLIYICNEVQIKNEEIKEMIPTIIKECVEKWEDNQKG